MAEMVSDTDSGLSGNQKKLISPCSLHRSHQLTIAVSNQSWENLIPILYFFCKVPYLPGYVNKNVLYCNFIVIQYCSNALFMIYLQKFIQKIKESFVMTGQTIGLLLVMIIYLILMVGIGVLYSKKTMMYLIFIWVDVNSDQL